MPDPQNLGLEPRELNYENLNVTFEQTSTRGDGQVELGEKFENNQIDFIGALEHLRIHHDGEVAGSQFNGDFFSDPKDVEMLLRNNLPNNLQYDQNSRVELTLDIKTDKPIGWSGVKTIEEIKTKFPSAQIEKKIRIPGGTETVEDGIEGAWYPEMAKNAQTGKFETALDDSGNIKNSKGKFEPKANIVSIPKSEYQEIAQTNKMTVIIQKDRESGSPVVLTVFPGENAPAFPSKINSETYKSDTLNDSLMKTYWENHVFIQTV